MGGGHSVCREHGKIIVRLNLALLWRTEKGELQCYSFCLEKIMFNWFVVYAIFNNIMKKL